MQKTKNLVFRWAIFETAQGSNDRRRVERKENNDRMRYDTGTFSM